MIKNNLKIYFFTFLLVFFVYVFSIGLYRNSNYQPSSDTHFGESLSLFNEDSSKPLHVFIDLGANKGDSIYNFIGLNSQAQGGNLDNSNFPKSYKTAKWIIYGFEANSFFDNQLLKMKQDVEMLNHKVNLFKSTAAWIYDGTIDFYLDKVNADNDFWGSSLNKNHVT